MPTLTLDAIRQTPWSVLTDPLPFNPTPLLLRTAALAASYLRRSEHVFMVAARSGDYELPGWDASEPHPDIHEESEGLYLEAEDRLTRLRQLYELLCGMPLVL